jgi:hypothetical protein
MGTYWKNREGFAGRGGIAAVLGSKNVKAVVVAGARKTELADAAALKILLEQQREPLKTGTKALSTYGTPFLVKPINTLGALGSYNLRQEVFAEATAISGEEMHAHFHDRDTTCLNALSPAASSTRFATASSAASGPRCPSTRRSSPSAPCWATRTRARSRGRTTSATSWAWTRSRWA